MTHNAIAASAFLLAALAACAPVPKEEVSVPPAAAPLVTEDLGAALTHVDGLTVRLGMTGAEIVAAVIGTCAPRSRYDGGSGPAAVLVCFLKAERGIENRVLRIALSKPEFGHRAWRIEYSRRRGEGAGSPVIDNLTARYGAPRSVHEPLEMWWRTESRHLRLIGETSGLRLQVWDRTLNGGTGTGG